jgi:uncharacterized protein
MAEFGSKKGKKQESVELTERKKLSVDEQIKELEAELSKTKYNKKTQHHIGLVKAKIARLREKAQSRGSGGKGVGFAVRKSGDATVILLGFPSAGKSTLLNELTGSKSDIGAYAFTTVDVIPGVLNHKDAKIQILDVPGIVEGAASGRGRGKDVLAVLRSADLVLITVDVSFPEHYPVLLKEAHDSGLRLNMTPPIVKIVKKDRGGIRIGATCKLNKIDMLTIEKVMQLYRVNNADVVIRSDIDVDDLIDALEGNRKYVKAFPVITKSDTVNHEELLKVIRKIKGFPVSATTGENINALKDEIFNELDFIRIHTKEVGKKPDMEKPYIMFSDCTVKDLCNKIHKDFVSKFKFAKIWGSSAKFDGQKKMFDHKLKDKDIVEIHVR